MKIRTLILTIFLGLGSSLYTADWGYSKENGPNKWGNISDDYKECSIGTNQSPIDIASSMAKQVKNELRLNYQADSSDIINNGHSVQVNFKQNSTISFKNVQYKLVQIHFHTPSENKINGKMYPLEMHLVHQNKSGNLLVIGIFFEEGKDNEMLNNIIAVAPKEKGKIVVLNNINVTKMFPKSLGYFAFNGSLTTPPCSEKVQWVVLKNPISASKKQIESLHTILHDNARDVQPINDRDIESAN